jgi:hypothetical protein
MDFFAAAEGPNLIALDALAAVEVSDYSVLVSLTRNTDLG